jgi:hypothetical protein
MNHSTHRIAFVLRWLFDLLKIEYLAHTSNLHDAIQHATSASIPLSSSDDSGDRGTVVPDEY